MRGDIQVLRGIAVFLVLGFHAEIAGFKSGFLGVDIFFVISGYVIQRQLQTLRAFDFLEFYLRRALRIFPTLVTLLLTITILGKYFFYYVIYLNIFFI